MIFKFPLCDWCKNLEPRLPICGEQHDGWGCTRMLGHSGPHVACGIEKGNHDYVRWGAVKIIIAEGA